MKIAFLTSDSREVVRRYSDANPGFGTAPEALLQGFAELGQCEVHVISCLQRPVSSPSKLAGNIYYHSIVVPKWGWLRSGYSGCIYQTRKKIREIQPDIVHGQGTERDCSLAAVFSGLPNVVTIHGNMRSIARLNQARTFSFLWLTAHLEKMALSRSDGVFCNSAFTESEVKSVAQRTWPVPNPLRKIFLEPSATTSRDTPPVLLNIGVVEPRKQQIEILEMAGRMRRQGCHFQLKFLGRLSSGNNYGAQFLKLIEQDEYASFAQFIGEKNENEVRQLMDQSSALIHAPKEEAFGLAAAEALARNLRLFGFKVGGLNDIAAGVPGAEMVAPGDFQGLEKVIIDWLKNAALPGNGSQCMRARYHPSVIARRHLGIYEEVLNDSPAFKRPLSRTA